MLNEKFTKLYDKVKTQNKETALRTLWDFVESNYEISEWISYFNDDDRYLHNIAIIRNADNLSREQLCNDDLYAIFCDAVDIWGKEYDMLNGEGGGIVFGKKETETVRVHTILKQASLS